jgi:hypothetical protein
MRSTSPRLGRGGDPRGAVIGNQATPGRLMTPTASGAVMMLPEGSGRSPAWVKTGTNPGLATYHSALTGDCLTMRGLPSAPVVRVLSWETRRRGGYRT